MVDFLFLFLLLDSLPQYFAIFHHHTDDILPHRYRWPGVRRHSSCGLVRHTTGQGSSVSSHDFYSAGFIAYPQRDSDEHSLNHHLLLCHVSAEALTPYT